MLPSGVAWMITRQIDNLNKEICRSSVGVRLARERSRLHSCAKVNRATVVVSRTSSLVDGQNKAKVRSERYAGTLLQIEKNLAPSVQSDI